MRILETIGASAVINAVAKQAQDFVAAATGSKGESIGTILGEMVDQRHRNAETVA